MENSFIKYIEKSIKTNWEQPALSDYKASAATYKDVARKIEKLHILFESCNIEKGDKIALCSRNSSHWGTAFLAILTYGAVPVTILHDFKPDNIQHIVNHSESKLFFVGDVVWENMDEATMSALIGILRMEDYSLRVCKNENLFKTRERLNELFGKKFPERFAPEDVDYRTENLDDLAIINYTSGTTSNSKGVMLSYRTLITNLEFAIKNLACYESKQIVAMLPMAHMYGLAFEFIYQFVSGVHIFFLTRNPSPKLIAEAFKDVRPTIIIAVPLIVEKIVKKKIFPLIEKPTMKLLMNVPILNTKVKSSIYENVVKAFGGELKEMIIGGSALNKDVERFLKSIGFPFTVGYGMTECGPLISYAGWKSFKAHSCGRIIDGLDIKIDSQNPQNIVGEIMVKGNSVMLGYYKNEDATRAAIDREGWLHTGDLGLIDSEGNIFIKGRSKNMILGPSGQNIYPEEIEDKLNNLPYVSESIVIESNDKIIALVYPDYESLEKNGEDENNIENLMNENLKTLNTSLPAYSQVYKIKIFNEEFEKTPKRSIKRFLYQNLK